MLSRHPRLTTCLTTGVAMSFPPGIETYRSCVIFFTEQCVSGMFPTHSSFGDPAVSGTYVFVFLPPGASASPLQRASQGRSSSTLLFFCFFCVFATGGGGGAKPRGFSISPRFIFLAASSTPPWNEHQAPHLPPVTALSSRKCLNIAFFDGNAPPHSWHDAGVDTGDAIATRDVMKVCSRDGAGILTVNVERTR